MICSLLVDADDSPDFPGNTATVLGRPLSAYPMMAARGSSAIQRHYAVTDSQPVKSVAAQNGASIIDPPKGEAAFDARLLHAAKHILAELEAEKEKLELLCVFSAQTPTVTSALVDAGIEAMLEKEEHDSAMSVSAYNRHNPLLARRVTTDGSLEPVVRAATEAGAEFWYPDLGVQILRPAAFTRPKTSVPLWWLGSRVLPLKQWGGGPVDFKSQLPAAEFWLKKHGHSDISGSYEPKPQPKPQAKPRDRHS